MTKMETNSLNNEWDEPRTEKVSIEELDAAVAAYRESRADYEAKKAESNEANLEMKEKMRKLQTLLERAGRDSWESEEGKVSVVNKLQYTTPKTAEDKMAFARWLEEHHGKDSFWTMFGVNSMTLNGFLKQEADNNPEFSGSFPGISDPTNNATIRFTKKRSK